MIARIVLVCVFVASAGACSRNVEEYFGQQWLSACQKEIREHVRSSGWSRDDADRFCQCTLVEMQQRDPPFVLIATAALNAEEQEKYTRAAEEAGAACLEKYNAGEL